jgi:hypothetical protein
MATFNCTNIAPSPALRGQSVYITLSAAESLSIIPLLALGQSCAITSSSKTGYVDFIDTYGHSFRIKPVSPEKSCDSNTAGIMKVNELITVTL